MVSHILLLFQPRFHFPLIDCCSQFVSIVPVKAVGWVTPQEVAIDVCESRKSAESSNSTATITTMWTVVCRLWGGAVVTELRLVLEPQVYNRGRTVTTLDRYCMHISCVRTKKDWQKSLLRNDIV